MVHSHTVLTAVIAVGVASSALAAPINPVPSHPSTVQVTGAHPQNVPTRPHTISRQVTSDPQLPPVVPAKSLNAREFDVIVEEDHPHPHSHHHEGFEVEVDEHHGEEFKLDFEEEHRYPHHHHHHHHHGGEDFEVDVEFDEHHPHHHHSHHHHGEDFEVDVELEEHHPHHHHPHHHHGEDFEVDVELEEHRPHRHHGEENFEIEVEEHHHHHHHHHHHGGEHFEHKHHAHHAHHHEVEVVPIPIPVPVEHKNFEHSMGRPPKVVKDEVWVVATEGKHVDIGRRQDEGGRQTPAPAPGSDASSSAHRALMQQIQNFRRTPQGQKFSSNLREGVTKRSPVKSADTPNNAVAGDPSQLSQDLSKLPMSAHAGPSKEPPSAQSVEWTRIRIANPEWQKDMDQSGGDWEKFLKTKTGEDVTAQNYPALVTLVKQALKQHTNPNNRRSHKSSSEGTTPTSAAGASTTASGSGASSLSSSSSSALKRRSGTNPSGSSTSGSSASSTDGDSPMGSSTSSTDAAGLGATGSAAASSMGTGSLPSGTSSALGSTSGSAPSASPSGAATTSAGYSSAHKQLKGQHREEWKKFKEANPSVKEDLKKANGNVQEFLQTPSGQALAKENKAFQKFVETHVVEHHKKHGQNHHHQSASSQQPAPSDGPSSASSSPSSPASANGANSAPVGRSVLAARMGFGGGHGWSSSALPVNPQHGGHHHRVRSMPAETGDASGTPGQTSALPIQSSSSIPNGPGMGAVNGPPFPFSGTPSSAALSGPSTSGLPPSAPPNGNGQGPHPEGPGPHAHQFGPMGHEHHFGGPMESERHFGGPMGPEPPFGGPHHHNDFGGLPPANGNTGSVPGTPPNAATGASSLPPPPPSGATSQGMPGAPARRALQRVRRSTPYGNFGADLD